MACLYASAFTECTGHVKALPAQHMSHNLLVMAHVLGHNLLEMESAADLKRD